MIILLYKEWDVFVFEIHRICTKIQYDAAQNIDNPIKCVEDYLILINYSCLYIKLVILFSRTGAYGRGFFRFVRSHKIINGINISKYFYI